MESGPRPLAKLAITGGGRSNLTNSFEGVDSLEAVYPRGFNFMKRALKEFSAADTVRWFENAGLPLVEQDDHRIFPASQNAMDVVNTLLAALQGVRMECNAKVSDPLGEDADFYVVCTGGGKGMEILRNLPVETEAAVPSLFSFNLSDGPDGGRSAVCSMMGLSVEARLSIPATRLSAEGPLLITDWGFSGPAAIGLSSYAARFLASKQYRSALLVNWTAQDEESIRTALKSCRVESPRRLVSSVNPFSLPGRLWQYLCDKSGMRSTQTWAELGNKGLNRLAATVGSDEYYINGKTRFRDEFVTCGGVSLASLDMRTLESRNRPGLYFAGEVLDVDALTGGFNLQGAWTTAYIVSKSIINSL